MPSPLAPDPASGAAPAPATTAGPAVNEQELESSILNHAILAGALELLPGSLATMAILPLQMDFRLPPPKT